MKRYLIITEKTRTGYSAYSPDLPGCVATAATKPAILREMRTALSFHVEGLRLNGTKLPKPRADATFLEVVA